MSTKLIAAELAVAAGVTTVVMNSVKVADIFDIIADGPGPSCAVNKEDDMERGPLCTRFLRYQHALKE